jgi:peptide/nickel transport system permease protein
MIHLAPGDPVYLMIDETASEEAAQALREKLGLDKPLHIQYLTWLNNLIHGDFGTSLHTHRPVLEVFFDRFPISFALATISMGLAVIIAIPIGILSAYKHNTVFDYGSMFFAMMGMSIPNFALGLLLIVVVSLQLDLLPISGIGFYEFREDPWLAVAPWILPVVSLAIPQAALQARLLRSSMLEVIGQDYIMSARAKGLRELPVLTKHALRNALIPLITTIMTWYAFLMGATIITEHVFAIPGIATVIIQAVRTRDIPVVQGFTMFIAIIFIIANLIADILYTIFDPRIRYK